MSVPNFSSLAGLEVAEKFVVVGADMKIVASTASTLEEPSQKNTLKTHDPLTFAFEEPSKQRICLRNLRP